MTTTAEFIGRRVGRFTITSHLASGGMAELFIARQEAVGGFEKSLVLKMLQERYASNSRVVEMFLDEARLAAKLNHQNIVHVYDVDEAAGIRYIAMEYIHGETVTDIVRRSIARGSFLPMEHAIHIVAETAAGLAYAHEHRDLAGRPARIVHRDISPSNILVTYEGLTKIVDFGIARVQDQIREESGMRPGKVSYMSPEQVRGEGADHRSDIFSLGIILYELTVGRRLWRGPPEVVMRRIVEEQIPPPTYVRRDYPPALELIVMKALERRPVDRHQSAAELQSELNEFLDEAGLKSGSRRLSHYMKDLFSPDTNPEDKTIETAPVVGGAEDEVGDGDSSEDLDFDRRAPLMLRVEARSGDGGTHGVAPVPPLSSESQPRQPRSDRPADGSHRGAIRESPNGRDPPARPTASPVHPMPGQPLDPASGRASATLALEAAIAGAAAQPSDLASAAPFGSGAEVRAASEVRASEVQAAEVQASIDSSQPASPGLAGSIGAAMAGHTSAAAAGGGNALRWVVLLVLAGAVVVVFLASR